MKNEKKKKKKNRRGQGILREIKDRIRRYKESGEAELR